MLLENSKANSPFSITSSLPGANKVPLGSSLRALADARMLEDSFDKTSSIDDLALESFLQANERYADATRLNSISAPHAIKAWAAERLPVFKISYGLSNRAAPDTMRSNLDEQASLKIVQFADDITMIARYCRKVDDLRIDMASHSHGIEFRFIFTGQHLDGNYADVEQESIRQLLDSRSRDNTLKNRIIATEGQIEAESVVLRKRVRLGFTPLH